MTSTFTCDTCYDTKTIDQGGREIACPDCMVFRYHPSSVTIEINPDYDPKSMAIWNARYIIRDRSVGDFLYGKARNMDDAIRIQRKRQGVIKAALTRRANKAARAAK
jgi:hypothetical protein